jgi:hypothetical protein
MENSMLETGSSGPGIGFPQVPHLKELQERPDLRETSFAIDFPLLTDPEVRHLMGNKGTPFGQAIHKRMFWDAANNKLLVRPPPSHHARSHAIGLACKPCVRSRTS